MSLAAQDRKRMDAAVDKAYACFREFGQETSRYRKVFLGTTSSQHHSAAFRRCLQARTRSAPALRTKLLGATRFLTYLRVHDM